MGATEKTGETHSGKSNGPEGENATPGHHINKHFKDQRLRTTRGSFPVMILVILGVSFGVYFNALFNGFVYDDASQILGNHWIRDIRYVPKIFSSDVWGFTGGSSNYYRPLMNIIYMMDYYLFGLKPWGFHLVNVLFHAANSVLVFVIVSRLLANKPASEEADKPSNRQAEKLASLQDGKLMNSSVPFIAALLFATHPIHTEAVSWVAGLPDLSFTFFLLLSFALYLSSERGRSKPAYAFSVLSFFLACLCKETALVFPFFLMAFVFLFERDGARPSGFFRRCLPYFIVAAVYFILRSHVIGGFAPQRRHMELDLPQLIINVFPLFTQYLGKLFFPVGLSAFHVLHPVSSLFETRGVLSLAVTIVFCLLLIIAFQKNKAAFLCLLLIALPLLPVLYIPGLGENTLAERYLYLPSAGFVMLFALLLARLGEKSPKSVFPIAAFLIVLICLYSFATVTRNTVWKDDFTLFTDTLRKAPDSYTVHGSLGNALLAMGKTDEAIEQYKIALALNPNEIISYNVLAIAYEKKDGLTKPLKHT